MKGVSPIRDEMPSGGAQLPRPEGSALSLAEVVRFVRRNLKLIAITTIGAVLVAAAYLFLIAQTHYEADATVVIGRSPLSSNLKNKGFSVQAYQRILESGAVIAETKRRLVAASVLTEEQNLVVGSRIRSEILVVDRDGTTAPLLRLVARAGNPEKAARIANTWAEVFVTQTDALITAPTLRDVELAEFRYQEQRKKTEALETDRSREILELDRKVSATTGLWDGKISALRQETEDRVAAYQIETRDKIDAIADEEDIATDGTLPSELRSALLRVVAVHRQLAQTLPYRSLERSISDEALWQRVAGSEVLNSGLLTARLVDQEVNPVHVDLSIRLSEVELEARDRADGAWPRVSRLLARLETTSRQRAAGYGKLLFARQLAFDLMMSARADALATLRSDYGQRIGRIKHDLALERDQLTNLTGTLGQATLARTELEDLDDVRIALPATASGRRLKPPVRLMLLASLVFGAGFGIFLALVREVDA